MDRPSLLERAFALAESGACRSAEDIRRRLKQEQYSGIDEHLAGPAIKRQLLDICTRARRSKDELAP